MSLTDLEAPAKAKCTALNKQGEPCKAPPVGGQTQCAGHLGLGVIKDPVTYQAKGAAARSEAREARKLGLTDALALKLARDAEQIAENWVAEASKDYRAAEMALTRLFGKPKETVELTGGLDLTALSAGERAEMVRRALAEQPTIIEALPESYRLKLEQG